MRAKVLFGVLLATGLLLPAAAQDKKPKKAPPEPKTWLCKKGELLWEEKFEGSALAKEWHKGLGAWTVEGGALKGADVPADKHHAYISRGVTSPNAIIQFSFKLDGAGWMGAFFDGKEHVSALTLGAEDVRIARMSGIGPTSKRTDVDTTKLKLKDGAWHTAVWEFAGDEMVCTIDDKEMVLAKAEGLAMDRTHLELNTAGGPSALFKDVKIWKAEPDEKWAQKRAVILAAMKKKPASLGYK
jgi:hypothetical protein